jgi:hypothetical protein
MRIFSLDVTQLGEDITCLVKSPAHVTAAVMASASFTAALITDNEQIRIISALASCVLSLSTIRYNPFEPIGQQVGRDVSLVYRSARALLLLSQHASP